MGTVHRLDTGQAAVPLGDAIGAYLSTLNHPESQGTRRAYGSTLRSLVAEFGDAEPLADLCGPAGGRRMAEWFTRTWGERQPATWNRNLDALRSAGHFWHEQGWMPDDDLVRSISRRSKAPDRTRARSKAEVEELLTREDISIRERVLWRLLYETAARSAEVLRLNVEDLDLANRRAKVKRKGGAVDIIVWQTGTARLLPRLLKGRTSGPLFLTDRKARVQLAPGDVDQASGKARLSYRRAEEIFGEVTGGLTLHQLRHSALTHAAEAGANTSTLLAFSGHTSVASLARYARVSPEALQSWQQERDPARRR
jgi:integrase